MAETKKQTDPWEIKKTVTLPRVPGKKQPDVTITINGRIFQIQRGKTVEVPQPVFEILEFKNLLADAADNYYYSNSNS